MTRLTQLHALFIILLCFRIIGCQPEELSTESRPNIIFLMADDQRYDAFGFMGDRHVFTPHLDQLASEGVVFENAYHVAPICMPSRVSVMTSQYLGTHGAGFDQPTNYLLTEAEFRNSYPVLLREQGYFTGFIGKFGFAVDDSSKVINRDYEKKKEYMPMHQFDVWKGFPGQGSYLPQNGKFNGYENTPNASHLTEFMGWQAIDFLQKASDLQQPFCLSVSFKAPHAPFSPDPEFRKLYEGTAIARRETDRPEFYEKLPQVVKEKSRNAAWYFGRTEDYFGRDIEYRKDWHIAVDSIYQAFARNYYGLVTGVDEAVGRIRSELSDLGIAKNTIMIYTSDNGFFAGSRQLMGKALLYEASAKAPMIVYDPRVAGQGGVTRKKGLISHVDIAPTLLDIAGVAIPENYAGVSFMPIVRGEEEKIHETVYGENNFDNFYPLPSEVDNPESYQSIRSRFVRTPEYKFIRYHETQPLVEELYRISDDPLEANNLIGEPAYSDIADDMRSRLDSFEEQYVRY